MTNRKYLFTIVVCILILMVCLFFGCAYNKQLMDVTYGYNYAWISLPNGECVEGKVQSWTDFEDGDQIQVKIDGVQYLTDTTRCVLSSK